MTQRLSGKVAIITGAARGIGATCAEIFAREGAAVGILDTNETRGAAVAAKIASEGGQALFSRCDVTNAGEIDSAIQQVVSALGSPNVLFNNAGIAVVGGVEELSEEGWDRQFAVNVKSIFLVSRRVIPLMREAGGGSIINMASESAFVGFPMHPAYCASKAAVVHLTRSMAIRYAPERIRVNSLCPGTIDTELYQEFLAQQADPEAVNAEILRLHPLGIGQPEDIAWAAVYMASDESRYMTGTPLMVEGGITAM
ncbi:MAG: glucose 1-dehydrogenase [Roseiflexaceae bacterium]|nr:glucose 1-dehydrogenase [Roseiflexaceae bacterium]